MEGEGGCIHAKSEFLSSIIILDSLIISNIANNGGFLFGDVNFFIIQKSNFSDNSALNNGGVVSAFI